MHTIYKFPLSAADFQELELPTGSRILSVAMQEDKICAWVLLDLNEPERKCYRIAIHGTGHHIQDASNYRFIGTIHATQVKLVLHVFEIEDPNERE